MSQENVEIAHGAHEAFIDPISTPSIWRPSIDMPTPIWWSIGRAGVWNIAPVLLYVGPAIACVNLLAVVVIARLGRRLSGTSHEVLPRAAGVSSTRAAQRARARPAAPRQSRRRAARAPAP
jgi:hypothetical protein